METRHQLTDVQAARLRQAAAEVALLADFVNALTAANEGVGFGPGQYRRWMQDARRQAKAVNALLGEVPEPAEVASHVG